MKIWNTIFLFQEYKIGVTLATKIFSRLHREINELRGKIKPFDLKIHEWYLCNICTPSVINRDAFLSRGEGMHPGLLHMVHKYHSLKLTCIDCRSCATNSWSWIGSNQIGPPMWNPDSQCSHFCPTGGPPGSVYFKFFPFSWGDTRPRRWYSIISQPVHW